MIAAKLPLGDSFKDRINYVFAGDGLDKERVLFAVADNLISAAREATAEMDDTWANQARLKAAAGIRRGGRPTTKPVRHDILSWDEDERPSSEEMARTARSYLAALGLAQQEAVIVGHDHNGKRHVHIVANTVNPMTGRVADMTGDQWKAQAWCLAYELAQGRVRCKHRMAPRIARAFSTATGRPKSGQRRSRPEWEREQKRKSADREARVRHKADAWAKLIDDIKASAANVRHSVDKQKADTQPAPRP